MAKLLPRLRKNPKSLSEQLPGITEQAIVRLTEYYYLFVSLKGVVRVQFPKEQFLMPRSRGFSQWAA